jgi:uncharacterized membrane protein (UPF0127 family)
MIRLAVIVVGLIMIFKKLYIIIKKRIENYRDTTKKHFFNVQVAKTPKEREIGFMNVKKLKLDAGMLFEYPDNSYPSVWMKNTLIPLDAIFINSEARVVHIEHNMEPHSLASRKTKKVCKYILEINGGLSKKMGINEGDLIGTTLLSKNITNFVKNPIKKKGKTLEPPQKKKTNKGKLTSLPIKNGKNKNKKKSNSKKHK